MQSTWAIKEHVDGSQ